MMGLKAVARTNSNNQVTSIDGITGSVTLVEGSGITITDNSPSPGDITIAATGGSGTVTTTGSPASGNLTKFSGSSSITNGDLSGDVTTSSTLVTTVAAIQGTPVSGTTGTTNVVLSNAPTLVNPVVGTQATTDNSTKGASTAYVTTAVANAVAGINPAVAVQAATTQASDTSGLTYNNGASGIGATFTGTANTAITIDGYTFTAVGQRLLVKNDTQSPSGAFNGIYSLTVLQTVGVAPVFTRALDYDTPSDINNTGAIPVVNGTVNSTTTWVQTAQVVTVGTTPLVYVQFSYNPSSIVTTFSAGSTGLTPSSGTSGAITLAGTLAIANGGTGSTTNNFKLNAPGITIDGAALVPATGTYGFWTCPYAGTITGWSLGANVSGSCVVDVWKLNAAIPTVANTITASALPTLSSSQYTTSTTLTGWTTSVAVGDVFGYNLNSASTLTRVTLQLNITPS